MKSIIISLESAVVRRAHIRNEFSKNNLSYFFFDALTPDLAIEVAKFLKINRSQNIITEREFACLMSHVSVWTKIIQKDLQYVAVFEDDIYLSNDANFLLKDSSWIHPDWHLIKIETFAEKVFLGGNPVRIKDSERFVQKLNGKNLGAAGYIISRSGAQFLLNYVREHPILEPLDHIIFDQCIKLDNFGIYQMNPALCIQSFLYDGNHDQFPSDLEDERKQRRKKESKNRSLKNKLVREVKRLYTRLITFLFTTKVSFK